MVYSERQIQSAERFPRSLQTTITPNGARTKQDLEVMSHFRASAEKSLPKWRSSFDKSEYPDCHMLSTRALRNRSREGIGGERTPCSPQPGSRTDRGIKGNPDASAEFNAPQVPQNAPQNESAPQNVRPLISEDMPISCMLEVLKLLTAFEVRCVQFGQL